jgi:putative flippase GtrA
MSRAALFQLGRHQIGSIVATAIDFGTMTLLVELAHFPPALATALGATAGGMSNFVLGRRWIFRAHEHDLGPQALRYATVSALSAGLNAGGEQLVYGVFGVQYIVARAIVAVLVSICWNFPMHRAYVFASHGRET